MGLWEYNNLKTEKLSVSHENMYKYVFDNAMLNQSKNVLEVGCGYGNHYYFWSKVLKNPSLQITAIDINKEAVDNFNSNHMLKYPFVKEVKLLSASQLPEGK